ncbi:unnamed protein product [Bacteroides ovatus V975]|nr:unnamed protein product [Bacteroides ovatus V975]
MEQQNFLATFNIQGYISDNSFSKSIVSPPY